MLFCVGVAMCACDEPHCIARDAALVDRPEPDGGCAPGRVTADRPDDSSDYQVHVVYALPNDLADGHLDTNGAIETSVTAANGWLADEIGQRQRMDTCGGKLDISFLGLGATDAEVTRSGETVRSLRNALADAGLNDTRKIYLVFYDGGDPSGCGSSMGGSNPLFPAMAALFLHGTPMDGAPCDSIALASCDGDARYHEFAFIHEIIHTEGFVASCAPHLSSGGHVGDDPRDVMYSGSEPIVWNPARIDVGRDDYYDHHIPNCLDLASSVFLDPPRPGAVLPPDWHTLPPYCTSDLDCRDPLPHCCFPSFDGGPPTELPVCGASCP
jgi:hypothetical protein